MLVLLLNDPDIRRDLWLYPRGDLLGDLAEGVISGIYSDNCPGICPAKGDDTPVVIEEPADRFERGLNKGEGFFEFQSV